VPYAQAKKIGKQNHAVQLASDLSAITTVQVSAQTVVVSIEMKALKHFCIFFLSLSIIL